MLQLRLIVPPTLVEAVLEVCAARAGIVSVLQHHGVVRSEGAAMDPPGDLIVVEVAREAADALIADLFRTGIDHDGAISVVHVDATLSHAAERAERAAPGAPSDAVVWKMVEVQAEEEARSSWTFHVFLTLATMIAAVAVVLDSAILVIGAMVVSPDFSPVAAACVGFVRGPRALSWRALRLLTLGFLVAVSVATLASLLARAAGWVDAADVRAARPQTGFIWTPDKWSFVVALLAGAVGVLSLTAARSSAMVGVFISVTTVPAAGAASVALATGVGSEVVGSATQLVVNVTGMLLSGTLSLLVLQAVWRRVESRQLTQSSRVTSR